MKILLIIPCYNEENNILSVHNKILEHNQNNKTKYDVLFINDGSKDTSNKILDENNISHIDLIYNLGIGGAVQTGYKYAYENNYDIAVQFDGDGQHDVNCVDAIINPIEKGIANMVIGSRFIEKNKTFSSTRSRRIGIKIISLIIKLFTKKTIFDPTSGFRAIDKKTIELFADDYPTEYPEPVSTTVLIKKGFSIVECPVIMHERTNGKSSIRTWKNIYYMANVLFSIVIASIRRY